MVSVNCKRLFLFLVIFTIVSICSFKLLFPYLIFDLNQFRVFIEGNNYRSNYTDTNEANDSLILSQKLYILPSNGSLIFNRLKFEIVQSKTSKAIDDRIYNQMRAVPSAYIRNYGNITSNYTKKSVANDSLILRQNGFILPKNGTLIFNRFKFEIIQSNNSDQKDDRIFSQMRYSPPNYLHNYNTIKEKLILLYTGKSYIHFGDFNLCPVSKCRITLDRKLSTLADVILWIANPEIPSHKKPRHQTWAVLFHESPKHTPQIKNFETTTKAEFNWTVTYRPDSTIPLPYYKYTPYDLVNAPPLQYPLPTKNYAIGKTKLVAWFVSNCGPSNDRGQVAKELQKYIEVDIYGRCGSFQCPRERAQSCFELLDTTYKFYLSFENSYCRYYITEKYYLNGLSYNVIPIVLGAHPDDYKSVSPPHSYIHVDDFKTLKDLADYLKYLDKNHTAYNEYFAWKPFGTVNFNTFFYCRLCMMAHTTNDVSMYYPSLHKWWHGNNNDICFNSGKWKDHK